MKKNELRYVVKESGESKPYNDISMEDFNILKEFHKDFLHFSKIYEAFNNSNLSYKNLFEFVDNDVSDENLSLKKDSSKIKYLTLSAIIFSRLLIDNLKHFSKELKNKKMEGIIYEFEKKNEYKMMKVLRNYTSHNSIPIDDISLTTSFSENKNNYDVIIYTSTLIKNKGKNSNDNKYLSTLKEDKICLVKYFKNLVNLNTKLFSEIQKEFSNNINSLIKNKFIEYFKKRYEINKNFIEIIPDALSIEEYVGKFEKYNYYNPIEQIYFDRQVVDYLLNEFKKTRAAHNL